MASPPPFPPRSQLPPPDPTPTAIPKLPPSSIPIPTMSDITDSSRAQGLRLRLRTLGPFFRVEAEGERGEVGRAEGVIRAWLGGKVLHLDSIRMKRETVGMDRSIFGLGLFIGAAAVRHGFDRGCARAELLAINDSPLYHSKDASTPPNPVSEHPRPYTGIDPLGCPREQCVPDGPPSSIPRRLSESTPLDYFRGQCAWNKGIMGTSYESLSSEDVSREQYVHVLRQHPVPGRHSRRTSLVLFQDPLSDRRNDNNMVSLVRFYTRMGFKAIREVDGSSIQDLAHMLVWGGRGTRMDADIEELLIKWGRRLKSRT